MSCPHRAGRWCRLKAVVYHGPGDIKVEERPVPEPGPRDILVELRACGICGSDLMDWYLAPRAPLVLGLSLIHI